MTALSNNRHKVLFILHLPPPVHGASIANNYIRNSAVINEAFDTDYISLATNTVLEQSGKGSFKKIFTFISLIRKIIKQLRAENYDLCYVSLTASGPAFYKDAIIVAILKLFKKKIIYHFHNKGVASAKKNIINDKLYKFVFKNTRSILISRHLYPDIKKYVEEKNVYHCPYGIPASTISHAEKSLQNTDAPCRILYLSNMMIEKGVFILLEACIILKKKKISFHCDFVGGWADITPEEFNAFVEKNDLSDVVTAHGPKYNNDKLAFFNNSDIFVFPTYYHYETFGIVNIEAMQHSLPVISTFEGGIPDLVIDGETGFLIKQKNVELLADKLAFLIHNPAIRQQMGQAGKAHYQRLFTIEKFEKNVADIIQDAIVNWQ